MSKFYWLCPACGSSAQGYSWADESSVTRFGQAHRCVAAPAPTVAKVKRPKRRPALSVVRLAGHSRSVA